MWFRNLAVAVCLLIGVAILGSSGASAAAIVAPKQALSLAQQTFSHSDQGLYQEVGKRRGRSHRWRRRYHRRRYRRHRRYRRGPRLGIYIAPPYYHHRYSRTRRYGRCGHWRRRCGANWGYGNSNFYGCMRYHGC